MAARGEAAGTGNDHGPLAAIAREFPGWHAWRSDARRFWATRTQRRRRPPGAGAGWAMTVDGDTADQLRDAIAAQEEHGTPG